MDLEQVEIHGQGRGEAAVAGPTAPELGFHAVKASAPVPMIVAFPEDRAVVRVAFVSPELPVNVPHPAELAGPGFAGAVIHMEPRRHRAMHVQVVGQRVVAAMNLRRLGGGKAQDGIRLDGKGLNAGAGVIPGMLQVAGRVESDVVGVIEIVVRVVVHVVLMERAPDAQTRAGGDEVAHAGITPVTGVGRVVHGQGVVIAAPLPIVNERHAVGDAIAGQLVQVGGNVGKTATPDVEHDLVGQKIAPRRRRVRRIGQHFRQVPGGRENGALPQAGRACRRSARRSWLWSRCMMWRRSRSSRAACRRRDLPAGDNGRRRDSRAPQSAVAALPAPKFRHRTQSPWVDRR